MDHTVKTALRAFYMFFLVCICLAAFGAYIVVRTGHKTADGRGKYEMIDADFCKIGKKYEDLTAPDGFSFYCISVTVKNTGQYAQKTEDVFFDFTTDDGIACPKEYDSYDPVKRDAAPIAPAGRTAVVENIVCVPDGCGKLSVTFAADMAGEGSAVVSLKQ